MRKKFKIKSNTVCPICNSPVALPQRSYCSKQCRDKHYSIEYREYHNQWQRNRSGKYARNKLMCGICGKWYVQVGTHTFETHGITGREYREQMGLPLKRGVLPAWYRELKGKQVMENGTVKNLLTGQPFRYVKGDERAKITTGWKGKYGSSKKSLPPNYLYV